MLDGLGLTVGDEAVYVALLDLPAASEPELAARCPEVAVDAALAQLEYKGLISLLPGRPVRYTAAPPDVALEILVRGREEELQRTRLTIARLTDRYRVARLAASPHEVVEVVTTREATLQRWEQLQRSAREQVRSFDRPPYVSDPEYNPVENEMLANGVAYRSIYHPAGVILPGRSEMLRKLIAAGEEARVAASVPVKMFIADDRLGLLPLELSGIPDSCLIIHASSLLDTLVALFEHVWDRAVPIHANSPIPELGPAPSRDDAALLGLLAAGLTDTTIAHQLGTHPRTVQRRVRGLLDKLDAATRFQAGLQAVRRGWL